MHLLLYLLCVCRAFYDELRVSMMSCVCVCLRHVVFGRHSSSHFMLFATDDHLYSWNMLNFSGLFILFLVCIKLMLHLSLSASVAICKEQTGLSGRKLILIFLCFVI